MGPLQGMKVIELAHIMSGPVCGMMLADMGADVIKVEKVPDGDDSRRFSPILPSGESASFMIVNYVTAVRNDYSAVAVAQSGPQRLAIEMRYRNGLRIQ